MFSFLHPHRAGPTCFSRPGCPGRESSAYSVDCLDYPPSLVELGADPLNASLDQSVTVAP